MLYQEESEIMFSYKDFVEWEG